MPQSIPSFALSITYALHMVATIVWIGGLAAVTLIILPAVQHIANQSERELVFQKIQKRLDPLGWFSLIVLVGTGMVQMSANPNYDGFLAITNRWASAILLKHIVFLGMMGISGWITWGTLPAVAHELLRKSKGLDTPKLEKIKYLNLLLLRVNLVLGITILIFTAAARAAS